MDEKDVERALARAVYYNICETTGHAPLPRLRVRAKYIVAYIFLVLAIVAGPLLGAIKNG